MVRVTYNAPSSRAPLTPQCLPGQTRAGHTWPHRAALLACGQWCAATGQGQKLSNVVHNKQRCAYGLLSDTVTLQHSTAWQESALL